MPYDADCDIKKMSHFVSTINAAQLLCLAPKVCIKVVYFSVVWPLNSLDWILITRHTPLTITALRFDCSESLSLIHTHTHTHTHTHSRTQNWISPILIKIQTCPRQSVAKPECDRKKIILKNIHICRLYHFGERVPRWLALLGWYCHISHRQV